MDLWLFYEATHRDHLYLNPISADGIAELEPALDLQPGMHVLDIACGHAELLISFVERYGVTGVGVDLSPYASARARDNIAARLPHGGLELIEGRGEDFVADTPFDVVSCVGASWIWKGYAGTLRALLGFTKPGGLILAGEPYWKRPPAPEYLAAEELGADDFPTLADYLVFAKSLGLECLGMRGATEREWDRYEMDQCASLGRFAREQPDHPDLAAIRAKHDTGKDNYLRWGRDTLGFALWVFRTPTA
jgi:SAM-dependent methyltransferase